MFKVGDKVKCLKEQCGCYVKEGEVLEVRVVNIKNEDFDIKVYSDESSVQYANSKNFVKVEE